MKEKKITREARLALAMIHQEGLEVAEGCRVGNSVAGSLLSMMYKIPRQYAEQGVRDALVMHKVKK